MVVIGGHDQGRYHIIPSPNLGTSYIPSCPGVLEDYDVTCILSIVAAHNDTEIMITVNEGPPEGGILYDGAAYSPGETLNITLSGERDAIQLNSTGNLSFGLVQASNPVGVVAGAILTPRIKEVNPSRSDQSVGTTHQMIPTDIWGRRFAITPSGLNDTTLRLDITGKKTDNKTLDTSNHRL